MGLDREHLQAPHKGFRLFTAALNSEGHHTAGTAGHVLHRQVVIAVTRERRVAHPVYLGAVFQELCEGQAVCTVLLHAAVQALQAHVQKKCVLRALDRSEIAHQLGGCFRNKCPSVSEFLRISDPVIAFVRSCQSRETVRVSHPVKFSGVDDRASYRSAVPVHVFGGGMGHDVRPELERAAVYRSSKRIVYDKRNSVPVRRSSKFIKIKYGEGRVCDRLSEHRFRIRPESRFQFFLRAVRADKSEFDTHLPHGDVEQIKCPSVDGGTGHNMIAAGCNVENSKEICSLAGRCQHTGRSALHIRYFRRHIIICRILQTGIKIAALLQIKQFSHSGARFIFERRTLNDRNLPRLPVLRGIT